MTETRSSSEQIARPYWAHIILSCSYTTSSSVNRRSFRLSNLPVAYVCLRYLTSPVTFVSTQSFALNDSEAVTAPPSPAFITGPRISSQDRYVSHSPLGVTMPLLPVLFLGRWASWAPQTRGHRIPLWNAKIIRREHEVKMPVCLCPYVNQASIRELLEILFKRSCFEEMVFK